MNYILKQFDLPLLKFAVEEDLASPVLKVLWVNEAHENLLPLDLKPEAGSLSRWIRHRTIPKNRAYVHALLAKCGLNLNRPMIPKELWMSAWGFRSMTATGSCRKVLRENSTHTISMKIDSVRFWGLLRLPAMEAAIAHRWNQARNLRRMVCCPNAGAG